MSSLIQSLLVLGLFGAMAAFVWAMRRHLARRYGVTEARVVRSAAFIIGAGVTMACLVLFVGRIVNSPILFATVVDGTLGLQPGDPSVARSVRVPVRRAGEELFLVVRPLADQEHPAAQNALIRYRFVRPDEKVVFNAELKFVPEQDRRRPSAPPAWGEIRLPFTPDTTGSYSVRLFPQSPGIAAIQLRLEDPRRAKGGLLGRWRL